MRDIIIYERPEVDSFGVFTIDERYYMMNKSFKDKEYGEVINYANSMVDSALRYVYRMIVGVEIEKQLNRKYVRLDQLSSETFKILNSELNSIDSVQKIQGKLIDIIVEIGKLRNNTSVSHGSATRTKSVNKVEARYVMFNAESIVLMLLDLLFNKTHSLKENSIGSVINSEGLKKYPNGHYKNESRDIDYFVFEDSNIIYQVVVSFPKYVDINKDKEFFSDWIKEFVEDDVTVLDKSVVGINKFKYYSKKKDFYYDVVIENNILYISRSFD